MSTGEISSREDIGGAKMHAEKSGLAEYLAEYDLDVKCVLTTPAESAADHGIHGINDGADFLLDRDLMDHIATVTTEEAIERMKKFA